MNIGRSRLGLHLAMLAATALPPFAALRSEPPPGRKELRAKMEMVARWQMGHRNGKPENTWTNGAFYAGVHAAYRTTGAKWLLDSMVAMGERNGWLPGKRFDHADDYAITQTYVDLHRKLKDPRMIRASVDSIRKMTAFSGDEVRKHGITWWWCDALFMAPPALAKLSKDLGDPSLLAVSDSFYLECHALLFDRQERLFARDASYLTDPSGNGKREGNGKKVFWSRGNGWVMAGLARLLEELPSDYPKRGFYVDLFRQMAERLASLQQPDGLWRSSLLDPDAFPGGEASGTGFNCYAIAWGIRNGVLDKETYAPVARSAWKALDALVKPDGKVGWVQPIGADPRRNFNAESWEAYGSGAWLLAASEMIRVK